METPISATKTVIFDIEANGLTPDKIWYIVCRDADTQEETIFGPEQISSFPAYAATVDCFAGHFILGYDVPNLDRLLPGWRDHAPRLVDTLVLSKLLDANISGGHSIEAWGERLGEEKKHADISDWSAPTVEMRERCISDVRVNDKLYKRFKKYLDAPLWQSAIEVEHFIAERCRELHDNGFHFSLDKCQELWYNITDQVKELDQQIETAFPPKAALIREVHPRITKHGTFNRNDFRFVKDGDLSDFNGGPFSLIEFIPFNPGSPVQIVERLNEAGWQPVEKTKGHIEAIRSGDEERIAKFRTTGWTVSEENLSTLPETKPLKDWLENCLIKMPSGNAHTTALATAARNLTGVQSPETTTAPISLLTKTHSSSAVTVFLSKIMKEWLPSETDVATFVAEQINLWSITVTETETFVDCSAPDAIRGWGGLRNTGQLQSTISKLTAARLLAKRIKLARRLTVLNEWIENYNPETGRIHGSFNGIGAWTHRMSHVRPNTGNIAREDALYGAEMRSMWCSPDGSFLVGVDAESIQLRVLAHYINDYAFTQSLLTGKKEEGTDPHSLNAKALGPICASRNHAKTFIYAWLLGAGIGKVAQILECSYGDASEAVSNFIEFYPGLKFVKQSLIPDDARRGYFQGFDGRWVKIVGDDLSSREHFCLAGYLQNGETTVMKHAMKIWHPKLRSMGVPFKIVNFVHDEWQTEVPDYETGIIVGDIQADAIREAGERLNLRCPMAGSILSGHGVRAIGRNWLETH